MHKLDIMSLTDIPINTIDGEPTSLAAFDGKVILVVNVASRCGLAPQYEKLEQLAGEPMVIGGSRSSASRATSSSRS